MTDLLLFITEMELVSIIRDVASHRHLSGCVELLNGFELFNPMKAPDEFMKGIMSEQIYLYPHDQKLPKIMNSDTIQPRFMGWIQIDPGLLSKVDGHWFLTGTNIAAEDRKGVPYKPATWLRQLKKNLKGSIVFGIKATNSVYGGSQIYTNIGYSQEALRLRNTGVIWKRRINNYIEYAPVDDKTVTD